MSWQDTALRLLGGQAQDVIARLQSINPNYDWSKVIQDYVPALNAAYGSDWMDPGRGSSAGIVSALLQNAQADGQAWASSALPAAKQAQQAQEAQIQQSQYHPSGGFGSLLGLAGLGLGLYSGIPMLGSALSSVAGGLADSAPAAIAAPIAPGVDWGGGDISGANMGFMGGSTTIPGLGISMPTDAATGIGADGTSLIKDSPWGVNPQAGGSMDMTGFLGNQDPFGYNQNFYQDLFGTNAVDPNAASTFQGGLNLSGSPYLGTLDAAGNPVQYDIFGKPVLNGSSMADPSFEGVLQEPSLLQRFGRLLTGGGASGKSASGGMYGSSSQGGIWDWLDQQGGLLGTAAKASPFLLALAEANRQSGQGQETIDQLRGMIPQYDTLSTGAQTGYADLNNRIEGTASGTTGLYDNLLGDITGNQSAFLRAQTDPYDLATHNQRQALQEGLVARGVAGSSFGNMDLGNFDTARDVGRAGIVGNALQSSLGLRSGVIGNRDTAARAALGMEGANLGASNAATVNALTGKRGLFDSILKNQQVNNVNRNALLGAGLSASGSLFRPQNNDPFGLAALLGRK